MLTGAVLAGGRSRRMGCDKALLPFAGEPLWRRQVRVLRAAGATEVAVVLRQGQAALPGLAGEPMRELRDVFPEAGPLAGLHAVLTTLPYNGTVMLLAVDLPCIEAEWFEWLRGHGRAGVGAVPRHAGGYEPLAALYPAATLPVVAASLAGGERSMRRLTDALVQRGLLQPVEVPAWRQSALSNCNAPADYAALRATESEPISF